MKVNRPAVFAIIDTETLAMPTRPTEKLVFDTGIVIMDELGNVLEQASYLTSEYMNSWNTVCTAYYMKNLFRYARDTKRGFMQVLKWRDIRKSINDMLEKHGVTVICAYNNAFDKKALEETTNDLTSQLFGKKGFFRKEYNHLDLWLASVVNLLDTDEYVAFAHQYGFVSTAGNLKSSAEATYAFINAQPAYVEEHIAIYDAAVEAEILMACIKKVAVSGLPINVEYPQPWRILAGRRAK